MDGGMRLEMALRKLIERGNINDVYGFATGFQLSIGNDECVKIAEYLESLMSEVVEE